MSKDAGKVIRITCTGAGMMPLDKIVALQGGLKELSVENYERLKSTIVKRGFSFPIGIAVIKEKPCGVIDGHQRHRVVKQMVEKEGYALPCMKLPVCWIECKNRAEAGRKILDAVSQFGKVTDEGLYEFATDFKIDAEELKTDFDLPDFDMGEYLEGYEEERAEAKKQADPEAQKYAGGLIYRPTVNKKRTCAFLSMRKWRTATKEADLERIKAAKAAGDEDFADFVAGEMAELISLLLRRPEDWTVTSPPPGHSRGKGKHFAALIAQKVASRLGSEYVLAFEPGTPKKGREQEHWKDKEGVPTLKDTGARRWLLVDDVATTGLTIEKCCELLSTHGAVLSVAWVYEETEL
ncbi:MAG: hypothetical protein WCP22_07860 [Chlamydiota bacterium]